MAARRQFCRTLHSGGVPIVAPRRAHDKSPMDSSLSLALFPVEITQALPHDAMCSSRIVAPSPRKGVLRSEYLRRGVNALQASAGRKGILSMFEATDFPHESFRT